MTKSVRSTLTWTLGTLSPALLAVGTFLPLVRLNEFNYTYSITGTPAVLIYGIATLVFTLNVVSVKLLNDIILQLHLVAMSLIGGCLIYGLKLSREGLDWFASSLAYNAPALKTTKLDAYWDRLNALTGGVNTMFGGLRTLYDMYGPGVTFNDVPIFSGAINSLNASQARTLIEAAGLPFDVMPVGIVLFGLSLLMQVITLVMLRGMRRTD